MPGPRPARIHDLVQFAAPLAAKIARHRTQLHNMRAPNASQLENIAHSAPTLSAYHRDSQRNESRAGPALGALVRCAEPFYESFFCDPKALYPQFPVP